MKHFLHFLLFFFLFHPDPNYHAQENPVKLTVTESISARNSELLSLTLTVENATETDREFTLLITAEPGFRIVNNTRKVVLESGAKAFLPVSIYVSKGQPSGESLILFSLTDESKEVARSQTRVSLGIQRELRMTSVNPQVMIFREGDSFKVSAQVMNNGNTTEDTEIVANFPAIYGNIITLKRKVTLEPFSSQIITFNRVVDRELLATEIFTVNIAGLDRNQVFFGNTMVTVQNAASSRRYIDPALVSTLLNRTFNNRIRMSARNSVEGQDASYLADGYTEFHLPGLEGNLNFNGIYRPGQFDPLYFSNTWLDLKKGNNALRLGNLNTSGLERNLYGRGASFTISNEENEPRFTAGILDKAYNLIEPFTPHLRGYSAYGSSTFRLNEKSETGQLLVFDREPDQQHWILMNSYRYRNLQKTALEVKLGYGHSAALQGGLQKSSMAGGLDFQTTMGSYHLNTNAFYSSAYYPGLRRGNTYLDQRISRYFDKQSVWVAFSYNRYRPEYVIPFPFGSQEAAQIGAEAGTQWQLGSALSLNLNPKWRKEKADLFFGLTNLQPVTFNTILLNSTLTYSPGRRNYLLLSYQQGLSEFENLTPRSYIHRIQLNWNLGNFTVNGSYQKGNFLIYEGYFAGDFSRQTEKLSAHASYTNSFWDEKFMFHLNTSYNYDFYSGTSIGGMFNADYRIGRRTLLQASFTHLRYTGRYYQGHQSHYQIGVQQTLPDFGEKDGTSKSGTLQVFLYRDLNNNRVYDPLIDEPASGIIISINNARFITDEKGSVQYRKVPYGSYRIRPEDSQWFAAQTVAEINQKNQLITIPLEKAGLVRGKFQYESTGIHQFDVFAYYSGIPLIFQDAFGTRYTFYANEKGEFHGYLPVGRYDVETNAAALQKNVYAAPHRLTIDVKADETNLLETIMLKVREKKVEIRKFGE